MSEKTTSLLAACAVTFLALAIAAPAVAKPRTVTVNAPSDDVPTRYVTYRDLNLAQLEGEKTLVKRVRYAVNDVCVESLIDDSTRNQASITCRHQSWQGAKPQIDRAVLRARQIATNGWSAIAPVAITISAF